MAVYVKQLALNLTNTVNDRTMAGMKKLKSRSPKPQRTREEYLEVRLNVEEKQSFAEAAALDGMSISAWVRLGLRQLAQKRLAEAGRVAAFDRSKV